MGGWCHPEITLDELLKLIKGFVDILILASGYQSSGRFAHWDPLNIKKAFQWGIFFENVFDNGNQESMDELNTALSKLTSDPHFPQGLTHISSTTLSKARFFILEHFIRTLPMRDEHLKSVLKATIEMDLDELQMKKTDYLDTYLNKLMIQNTIRSQVSEGKMDFSPRPMKTDLTAFVIEGVTKRKLAVSCVSSMETCVDVLAKTITQETLNDEVLQEQQNAYMWNNWRTKTLSYLLDKQTIRLVSGASMIFSASKVQWARVLEQLDTSSEEIETFEQEIIEYLEVKLNNQIHRLWELPPTLIAASLPPWSRLFEAYASELLNQFKGKTTNIRCCSCSDDNKEHIECKLFIRKYNRNVKLLREFGASTSFMYQNSNATNDHLSKR
ncbi:hypothetical protein LXL04_018719 [Taraxacum kok-saghyz]